MRYRILLILLAVALSPAAVLAEDAKSIMQTMQSMQLERYEDVETYVVVQSMVGNKVALGYERVEFEASDGKTYPVFQPIRSTSSNPDSQAFLEAYADASVATGDAVGGEMDKGMQEAGLPKGMLGGSGGGDPWVSMDPRVMMGANAEFLRQAAAAEGKDPEEMNFNGIQEFAERARLVGTEKIDGRKAFHLVAEDINQVQKDGQDEFTLETVEAWIDTREYVPLRMKMTGTATSEGETRPMIIEKFDSDYRTVPGSSMYEPYRQVLTIAGVLTPEQQKQMEEAAAQMADLDKQLADLPPSQKEMILSRMGPQLEMIKKMADGGGMEMLIEVHEIVVNGDLAELQETHAANFGLTSMPPAQPMPAVPAETVAAPSASGADAELQVAQQACLQEKMEAAQAAQQKKRGFGRLLGAATKVASRYGGADVHQTMGDVYTANSTAEDVSAAAKDLGLTEADIEDCASP